MRPAIKPVSLVINFLYLLAILSIAAPAAVPATVVAPVTTAVPPATDPVKEARDALVKAQP